MKTRFLLLSFYGSKIKYYINSYIIKVKGEEPDKTNHFLQSFYRAATSGKDASKYIQRYLDHKKKKADEKKKDSDDHHKDQPEERKPEKVKEEKGKPKEKESNNRANEATREKQTLSNINEGTTEAKKTVTAQRPMSSLKKPEKFASEIKEVDDDKKINSKAPQGLIKDSNKNEIKEKNKNNDEDLSAPKSNNINIIYTAIIFF